jgi:hypothetical protein
MINKIDHCQYCYAHYDKCDCCKNCYALKNTCDCVEDGPTIMSPAHMYKSLYTNPVLIDIIFCINTIKQVDEIVMRMYNKDSWPERLKR